MNKMSKVVKEKSKNSKNKRVVNYMGGGSFEINPLDTLKIVSSSSIFGEPAYYRDGEFAKKGLGRKINDSSYYINRYVSDTVLDNKYEGMKTSDIMEKIIDESLDYDFEGTLRWAVELRKDFNMRLNPQVIMVRASVHNGRAEFTKTNPGLFNEINNLVMSRMDEPSTQLTYWLYKNGNKNKIPTILKKTWARKYEGASRYQLAKYKNSGLKIVDVVRICHASGKKNPLINELLSSEGIKFDEDNKTWETLRSSGKTWTEICASMDLPHMAAIRNLRGIFSEVNDEKLRDKILNNLKAGVKKGKQFPFRYYTAKQIIENSNVNFKPQILDALEECMDIATENLPKLSGKTMCLSDNSGSAWGTFNSEYGSVTVADIANLSAVITAKNSDEGYVGVFGDGLEEIPISKRNGILSQQKDVNRIGKGIGRATENGIWLFFDKAIKNKEHWDNIFIYSDQQAGHGGLYGIRTSEYKDYMCGSHYIDVIKLIDKYRREVNPKVNIFTTQVAGYDNVLVPENKYRCAILYGWTGKEAVYADKINQMWDEIDARKSNK